MDDMLDVYLKWPALSIVPDMSANPRSSSGCTLLSHSFVMRSTPSNPF
jgi:hypothetical protein